MAYVNIQNRKLTASLWLLVAILIFGSQITDAFAFNNYMQHLTNWAWIFHGIVAGLRALNPNVPYILTLLALGNSLFVAAGIASIQAMDNSMIENFEKEVGITVVTLANLLFHYIPPLFWIAIISFERASLKKYYQSLPAINSIAQTNLGVLTFASAYSVLFNLQKQYPGANINFYLLYGASTAAVITGYTLTSIFAVE